MTSSFSFTDYPDPTDVTGKRQASDKDMELLDAYSRAVVSVVESVGPAGLAGLRVGDLMVAINDSDVQSVDDLHRFLSDWPSGRPVKIAIVRGQSCRVLVIAPKEAVA